MIAIAVQGLAKRFDEVQAVAMSLEERTSDRPVSQVSIPP